MAWYLDTQKDKFTLLFLLKIVSLMQIKNTLNQWFKESIMTRKINMQQNPLIYSTQHNILQTSLSAM